MVLRGDDGELVETRIVVLRTDSNRYSGGVSAASDRLGQRLGRVGQLDETAHSIRRRELRLFGQYGRLAENDLVLAQRQCLVEQLLAFLHEDVQQLPPSPSI